MIDDSSASGTAPAEISEMCRRWAAPSRRGLMGAGAGLVNIENDRFVIAIPAIVQKAALRLPSLPRGRCAAAGPLPIDAAVDRIGALANLVFAWRVLAEILARSHHPPRHQ